MPALRFTRFRFTRVRVVALLLVVGLAATGSWLIASHPAPNDDRTTKGRLPFSDDACRDPKLVPPASCTHGGDDPESLRAERIVGESSAALAKRWVAMTGRAAQERAGLLDASKRWPRNEAVRDISRVLATNDRAAPVTATATGPWLPEPKLADLQGQPPCYSNRDRGPLIEVIYAVPVGRADYWQYTKVAIPAVMERVDGFVAMSSYALHGEVRRHLKHLMWSTCALAVKHVVVPAGTDTWTETVGAIRDLGFDDQRKRKYVVFLQAQEASHPTSYCGQGGYGFAVIYNLCGSLDMVVEHELAHALGAVGQPGAPHRSGDGHYTDGFDRMVGEDHWGARACASPGYDALLDCNGDDYFNPAARIGSWLGSHPVANIAHHPVMWGVRWQRVLFTSFVTAHPEGKDAGGPTCRWTTKVTVTTTPGVSSIAVLHGSAYSATLTGMKRLNANKWTANLEIVGPSNLTEVTPTFRAYRATSPQVEAGQKTVHLPLRRGTC